MKDFLKKARFLFSLFYDIFFVLVKYFWNTRNLSYDIFKLGLNFQLNTNILRLDSKMVDAVAVDDHERLKLYTDEELNIRYENALPSMFAKQLLQHKGKNWDHYLEEQLSKE